MKAPERHAGRMDNKGKLPIATDNARISGIFWLIVKQSSACNEFWHDNIIENITAFLYTGTVKRETPCLKVLAFERPSFKGKMVHNFTAFNFLSVTYFRDLFVLKNEKGQRNI